MYIFIPKKPGSNLYVTVQLKLVHEVHNSSLILVKMAVDPNRREYQLLPLDTVEYEPDEEAKEFYKKETGITDDEELKQHILKVREKAYSVSVFTPTSCTLSLIKDMCRSSSIRVLECLNS